MDVEIKPELRQFIDDQLKAGHYESADEMINTALSTLQAQEWRRQNALMALRDLQNDSVSSGRDKLTMDDIENEIHSARRERK